MFLLSTPSISLWTVYGAVTRFCVNKFFLTDLSSLIQAGTLIIWCFLGCYEKRLQTNPSHAIGLSQSPAANKRRLRPGQISFSASLSLLHKCASTSMHVCELLTFTKRCHLDDLQRLQTGWSIVKNKHAPRVDNKFCACLQILHWLHLACNGRLEWHHLTQSLRRLYPHLQRSFPCHGLKVPSHNLHLASLEDWFFSYLKCLPHRLRILTMGVLSCW